MITPAMASEPYWAAALSLSVSTDCNAMEGIVPISGPCAPKPPSCINAARWRRLPLTSTRVWCESRPRMLTGRMNVAPSEIGCRVTLNDGTRVLITSTMSDELTLSRSGSVNTSTGTAASAMTRAEVRVPMVTISSIPLCVCLPASSADTETPAARQRQRQTQNSNGDRRFAPSKPAYMVIIANLM